MPAIKLCIIGGGSHYTHHMLRTFSEYVHNGDLAGSVISLYDIDREHAQLMADFANSVAKAKKADFRVEAQGQLEKALEGANFVFSSIRVGGYEQLRWDESVPTKYGLIGQETSGISGVFMICRQAPVISRHIKAIEKVCPDCFVINYSNPSGMVTRLTHLLSNIKCAGLCDGVYGVKWLICVLLGLPFDQAKNIEADVAGVNHCTWTLRLRYRGEDLYPRIGELFEKLDWNTVLPCAQKLYRQAWQVYRYYGLLPGSLCYTRYHFYVRDYVNELTRRNRWHADDLSNDAQKIIVYVKSQVGKADADFMPWDTTGAAHGDQAMGTLRKLACNTREIEIVNVKNNGIVANMANDAVVEVPAMIAKNEVLPLAMGPLPESVAGHVIATDMHYRLAVKAAVSGNRNLVMQAAKAFPSNIDFDLVEKCVNELFDKHKDWLPQFKT